MTICCLMRRLVAGVVLAALPASLGDLGAQGQTPETPRRGGTLVFSITNGEPASYDCQFNTSTSVLYRVAPHYSTLVKISQTNYPEILPDAAESWAVSDDGLAYSFKLRPGIRFHDGTALTSEDVKVTFERIARPPQGIPSVRQHLYRDIAAFETPDERTIVFRLSKPNAAMMTFLASPWACLYSARRLAEDQRFPERNVMGTGPFRFIRHVAGSEWIGERFDGYFRPGQPYLDGFRVINMSESAAVNAMSAGQIMTDFRGVTLPERTRIAAARGASMRLGETDQPFLSVLTFNTSKPPFNDARVRRALHVAIDRWSGAEALARVFVLNRVGGFSRPGAPFARSPDELKALPGFIPDMAANRAEARRLLTDAGQPNLAFTLVNRAEYTPLGIFLIDQWRQIGVTVQHEQLVNERYFASLFAGNFDVIVDANQDYADEPALQFGLATSYDINRNNRARYVDRKVDALFEEQSRAIDPARRKSVVRELEAHLLTESYRVPLFWSRRYNVMAAEVRGYNLVTPSNLVGQDLVDIWLAP